MRQIFSLDDAFLSDVADRNYFSDKYSRKSPNSEVYNSKELFVAQNIFL